MGWLLGRGLEVTIVVLLADLVWLWAKTAIAIRAKLRLEPGPAGRFRAAGICSAVRQEIPQKVNSERAIITLLKLRTPMRVKEPRFRPKPTAACPCRSG